jgi:hypothetical protein
MSKADLEQFLRAAQEATERHGSSEQAARQFLQAEGLIDEDGGLTEAYSAPESVHA